MTVQAGEIFAVLELLKLVMLPLLASIQQFLVEDVDCFEKVLLCALQLVFLALVQKFLVELEPDLFQ
jgi:hypothetical protein